MKPALARGELHCVGATTLDEYRKHIEKDPALERRFQPVFVGEPSIEDTVAILRGLKERYEVHHGVRIADPAIVAAVKLSSRYISDRQLPDKAIDLIDEAASRLRMEIDSKPVELDQLQRRIQQLEIEKVALEKETDEGSKKHLASLEKKLADLKEQNTALETRWKNEQKTIFEVKDAKEKLEGASSRSSRRRVGAAIWRRRRNCATTTFPRRNADWRNSIFELTEMQNDGALLKQEVTQDDVAEVVSAWTGVPVSKMLEGEKEKLLRMEERLNRRVIGQEEATTAVANAVRRARAGLQDPNRPIGSFLFLGPTGVGKTETCKALAEFLFDDEQAMVRIDMSEFMEKHSVARLIGAPPGYVGYEEGGRLTEAVRRRPYSVVLLDEVEKAHRDVFNVLLQVLDDGRLTDGQGRTVDFKNTVVIMTSNIGSRYILELEGEDEDKMRNRVMEALKEHFLPEFLNRIDDVVIFHNLDRQQLRQIVRLQVERLQKQMADLGVVLKLTEAAMDEIVKEGYDPMYGARPLKRVIQQRIANPLATELLEGRHASGGTIIVDSTPDGFVFQTDEASGEVIASTIDFASPRTTVRGLITRKPTDGSRRLFCSGTIQCLRGDLDDPDAARRRLVSTTEGNPSGSAREIGRCAAWSKPSPRPDQRPGDHRRGSDSSRRSAGDVPLSAPHQRTRIGDGRRPEVARRPLRAASRGSDAGQAGAVRSAASRRADNASKSGSSARSTARRC